QFEESISPNETESRESEVSGGTGRRGPERESFERHGGCSGIGDLNPRQLTGIHWNGEPFIDPERFRFSGQGLHIGCIRRRYAERPVFLPSRAPDGQSRHLGSEAYRILLHRSAEQHHGVSGGLEVQTGKSKCAPCAGGKR